MIRDGVKYYKQRVDINEIKVSDEFKAHKPNKDKIDDAVAYYKVNGCFDKIPILSRDFYVNDGYARYLAARILELKEIEVWISSKEPTCYVYGVHPDDKLHKERVWRVPKNKEYENWSDDVLPGDTVWVKTCHGNAQIIVTKIHWLEDRPYDKKIRSVCLNRKVQN